jgi:ABC-2 type transport system ATP-binding protein
MSSVIETHQLTRAFAGRPVVRAVNLNVPRGAIYAFLGPNGAGKSTTIRMLLGLLRPDAGTVALLGEPFDRHRLALLPRSGSLVESPSLYPHLTGTENLGLYASLRGRGHRDIARVLALVGLADAGAKRVRHFSLGMKQRLALAQALLADPELLILDEPANGLDPAGIQEMRELMRSLAATHGVTVFLSSHLLSEVDQLATHIGVLSEGTLAFQGTSARLADRRRARLRIGVDRPSEAAAVLEARGWPVTRDGDTLIAAPDAPAAQLNRTLIDHGHEVHTLAREADSLEDVFFSLTKGAAA